MEHQDHTDRDRLARDIFLRAAEIHSPEAQAAYLEGACQQDASLRSRVDALLENHRQDSFLEHAAAGPRPTLRVEPPLTEAAGTKIGRYKLLQQIGEGGMGVVYMAEQEEPVRRRVALKIIKLGMDTRQVVARFEAERQALALMDHPNIAKVLDGGTTETGRPFFVMELVQGVPIMEFCDKNKLQAVERLKLFIQVCQAVQSAHQKGIIHRDLKPSNILVTLHHGEPMPKVIDFGIAKATNQKLTEKTLFTLHATMIGTPAYMSPEQAEMTSMDVDTRTDIYSLGVLLYELLTGSTPFPEKRLRSLGYGEMQRVIADEEPERPSTRLSTLADEQKTAVAKNRGEDFAALDTLLRGDLDWIVMKCLEKDRTRRYETANGLAADLKRHLNNEPVLARPPSAAYKFQKALRRNKVVFAAGTAVALALVVGVIGTTAGLVRAERQRRAAQTAQREESRQKEIAVKALDGEKQQTAQAAAARDDAEALAYASAINLAQQALANENLGQAVALLDRQRPKSGQPDRRGWEWRYLWQQARSDALASPLVLSNRFRRFSISPDGSRLVAAAEGLAFFDISDPRRLRLIDQITSVGQAVLGQVEAAFSPDGELLAFSALDHIPGRNNDRFTLRLMDTRTRRIVGEAALAGQWSGISFSPDGTQLLTYTPDSSGAKPVEPVAVWQVAGLKRIASPANVRFAAEGLQSTDFAVTRDWSALANEAQAADGSTRLQITELATGKPRWKNDLGGGTLHHLRFSPDGKLLFGTEGYDRAPRVRIWDAASGKELGLGLNGHREMIFALASWQDGKTVATASVDQTIRLWDIADPAHPQPIGRPLHGHQSEVWGLTLLPDQRTLVSVGKDGTFLTWDTQQARPDRTRLRLEFPDSLFAWQFSPDGKSILAVEDAGQVTRLSGPDFGVREGLVKLGKGGWNARFSKDGRFVAKGSTNGMVQLWDLERRSLVKEFAVGTGRVRAFDFREDAKRLIVFADDEQPAREWDLATFKETASWQDISGPSRLSADGRWFFTLDGEAGRLLSRDLETGLQTVRTNLDLRIETVTGWNISPNGNLLAVTSERGFVRLLDRATLRPIDTLRGFLVEAVFSVCFTPDGKRMATTSGGREPMRLWDAERRHTLVTMDGTSRANFGDSQFSEDGDVVGAMSYGGDNLAVHLWRAPSWEEIEQAEAAAGKPQTP